MWCVLLFIFFFIFVFAVFKLSFLCARRSDVLPCLDSLSILPAKGYLWAERTVRVRSMGGQCGMMSQNALALTRTFQKFNYRH